MNRTAIGLILTAFGIGACSSCSNGGSSDGGTSGGACANVAICTVIPLAQMNSATKKMLTTSAPTTENNPNSSDKCDYTGTEGFVAATRICFDDVKNANAQFDGDKVSYLAPMGTRSDVAGVGEKAFYQSEPTGAGLPTTKVKFSALKGAVYVSFTASNVAPADDAMVKQGFVGFANTLLK